MTLYIQVSFLPVACPSKILNSTNHFLAGKDGGAGVDVGRRDGPVDVDLDAGVRSAVGTRECDLVGRLGAAAAGDAELGARDVELSAAGGAGAVETEMLGAEEVVAGLDAAGDGDGERSLSCRGVSLVSLYVVLG
jgi:hypothetical protein